MPRRGKRINVALTALLTCDVNRQLLWFELALNVTKLQIPLCRIRIWIGYKYMIIRSAITIYQNLNFRWHILPLWRKLYLMLFQNFEKLFVICFFKFWKFTTFCSQYIIIDHNLNYGLDIQLLMGQILDILSLLNMGHIVISNMFV